MSKPVNRIKIRPMAGRDLAQVESIDQASFPLPWPSGSFHQELYDNPISRCWVAEARAAVAGALVGWLIEDEFQIATIAVRADFRRKGVGAGLLEAALDDARQNGARTATLEVRRSNTAAQSLYRKFGFRIVGVRPRLYMDGEDALTMSLDLAAFGRN